MQAGKLRHRITIQSLQSTQNDSNGNFNDSWMAFAVDWPADVHPLSGREFIQGGAEQSEVVDRITIRYLAGVKKAMRVLHEDQVFNIKAVLPDAKSGREYLTLMVSDIGEGN